MSAASRRVRRKAARAGLCPNCLERPVDHVVPVADGEALVACSECWPLLRDDLAEMGAVVSGCMGPCCNSRT